MPSTVQLKNANPSAGAGIVWHDVSWEFYENFLREFDERYTPHSFVSETFAVRHRDYKALQWAGRISRLVCVLTEELTVPRRSLGSSLLKHSGKQVGAEPDEAFLLRNAMEVANPLDYNVETDPPPDLVIDVDIAPPGLNRLAVYAALGVPEVWIYDGENFQIAVRQDQHTYETSDISRSFPTVPMREFAEWFERLFHPNEMVWIRAFREWVQENVKTE